MDYFPETHTEWLNANFQPGGHGTGEEPIFMQCTGLKDKNGKEIYEKDITDEGAYTDWCKKCVGYQQFGIYKRSRNAYCHSCTGGYSLSELMHDLPYGLEIVGNIYENPELLN